MPGAWLCAGWRGALRAGAAGASPGGSPPPCGLTVRVTCSLPPRPVSRARPSRGTARGERGAGSPQVWTRSPPRAPGRLSGAPGRGVPEQLRAEDRRAAVRPTLGGLGGLTIWRNARAALFSVRGSGRGPAALVGSQPWPPLGLFPARGTAWPGLCSQLCLTPEGKGMERLSYLPGVPRLGGNRIRSHTCLLSNPRSFPLPRACPSFVEQLGSPRPPPRPPGVTARTQGGGRLPRFPCAERRGPELQGKGAPGLEGQAPSCDWFATLAQTDCQLEASVRWLSPYTHTEVCPELISVLQGLNEVILFQMLLFGSICTMGVFGPATLCVCVCVQTCVRASRCG